MAGQGRSWSERWAAKENTRRLDCYNDSLRRWNADLELIRWAQQAASTASPRPARLSLHRGEELYWETSGALMVEMPDTINLFSPVHNVYSPTRTNGGYAALPIVPNATRDQGYVAITNQRVIFQGAKGNREWAFAQLTGIAHGISQPLTLMRVTSRKRLSGLMFDGTTAAAFQLFAGLCNAIHRQERPHFLAHLNQAEAAHLANPPLPPLTAAPADAPDQVTAALRRSARIFFGPSNASSARKLIPTFAAAFALLLICGALNSPPKNTDQAPAGLRIATETTAPAVPPAALPPTLAPTPVVVDLPPSLPPAPATTKAPPPPAPTQATESTCGAPENPWGYDFCAGGSTINDPPQNFCSYFPCIDNFWKSTNGYVTECKDGMFSHSGGVQGSCSYHGGNGRKLTT